MAEIKLPHLIGMPLVLSVVLTGLLVFFANVGTTYGIGFDNTSLENIIGEGSNFAAIGDDYKDKDDTRFQTVTTDLEGNILNQALRALDTVKDSISAFGRIAANSVGMLGIGDNAFSQLLITTLGTLALIAVMMGIFVKAIFKVEL